MYQCPNCNEPFLGARKLSCNHLTCNDCTEKNTGVDCGVITCPYEKCSQKTALGDAVHLKSMASDDLSQPYEKAMEDDLLETAKEFDLIDQSMHQGQAGDHLSASGYQRDCAKRCPVGDDGKLPELCRLKKCAHLDRHIEDMCVDAQYAPLKPQVVAPNKDALKDAASEWDLLPLMLGLAETVEKCPAITGFSESDDGDKVEVDIAKGQRETVQIFLRKHYANEYATERLVIIEQEGTGDFLVGIGTKITSGTQLVGESANSNIADYGTVTCLAEEEGGQNIFLLTSHHVINQNQSRRVLAPAGQSGVGTFVSSYHNTFEDISDYYHGILGTVNFPGYGPYNIDIAALKLREDVKNRLKSDQCSCRMQDLVNTYTGSDRALKGMPVRKNGAATGVTCGKIEKAYFLKYDNDQRAGWVLMVIPQEGNQHFATKGDSGALVWSTDGNPIGIVSYHQTDFKHGSRVYPSATFVVRLDRCIAALQQQGLIRSVECKAHGSPVPIIKYQEQPGNVLAGASAQQP